MGLTVMVTFWVVLAPPEVAVTVMVALPTKFFAMVTLPFLFTFTDLLSDL